MTDTTKQIDRQALLVLAALSRRPAAEQPAAAGNALTDEVVRKLWSDSFVEAIKEAGNGVGNADVAHNLHPLKFAAAIKQHLRAAPQAAPTYRKATTELSLPELAKEFAAVAELGGEYTLSAGVCAMLYKAMTTPPQAAQGEGLTEIALLNGGGTLHREACSGGGYAWHVWNLYSPAGNLMRTLDKYEKALVDSAIAAHTRASDEKAAEDAKRWRFWRQRFGFSSGPPDGIWRMSSQSVDAPRYYGNVWGEEFYEEVDAVTDAAMQQAASNSAEGAHGEGK